jgi:uncharacterized protein
MRPAAASCYIRAMTSLVPLDSIFASPRPLVGMVHLPPLPGSPLHEGGMAAIVDGALADARTLADAGFDAILVENLGDSPYAADRVGPLTIASLTVAVAEVIRAVEVPVGVNVLRNDAAAALAIAAATGARFIRVNVHVGGMLTDQGWISGRAHDTLRERARIGARIAILADVLVKHAVIPPGADIAAIARDTWGRGHADGLIVSGGATGEPTSLARVDAIRAAVPDAPVWIGSGLNAGNAATLMRSATGAIVGSAVQHGGRAGSRVEASRARALVEASRSAG